MNPVPDKSIGAASPTHAVLWFDGASWYLSGLYNNETDARALAAGFDTPIGKMLRIVVVSMSELQTTGGEH